MIAVDTSALLAIIFGEPERDRFLANLDSAQVIIISAATLVEARMVTQGRAGIAMVQVLDGLIEQAGIETVAVDYEMAKIAHHAFVTYGKGQGHPAQLNFGDLFSYALAKAHEAPLLYKGSDFSQTDVVSAVAA